MTAPCELLPWDTEFFGRRIARVTTPRLTPESAEAVERWCRENGVECLYYLAEGDAATVNAALERGFRQVDVRVTLEAATGGERPAGVRPWRPDDLPALKAIARVSHVATRFYHDGNFPREKCDALYETWIERSCGGWADAVLVADHEGRAAGYLSCHGEGKIGLVGVAASARGRGLGSALVRASLRWFADAGLSRASVVTQGRNEGGRRLYEKCGFKTRSAQIWFHRWFA